MKPNIKLSLEQRSIYDLIPYEANSKNHNEHDIAAIRSSIERFGFNDPISVTPDGVIIEGHGRWMALNDIEGMDVVPVLVVEGLTEDEYDLYRIAHNKISQSSTFNFALLYDQLQELVGGDHEISFMDMGFSDKIVDNLFMHFAPAEDRAAANSSEAANSAPIEYDIIWDTKEDKAKFVKFMADQHAAGADKSMGGEVLMAAIRSADPELYEALTRAVPGDIPLDQIAGEAVHVAV